MTLFLGTWKIEQKEFTYISLISREFIWCREIKSRITFNICDLLCENPAKVMSVFNKKINISYGKEHSVKT